MTRECDMLDAYLADDLPADAARQFSQHLEQCDSCREVVEQQRWIDGLLRVSGTAALERPSPALVESFRTQLVRRRRQSRLIVCGLAAATVLGAAVGWTTLLNRQSGGPPHRDARDLTATINAGVPAMPVATFVGGPDVIVESLESQNPNVSIVRVYPTFQSSYAHQASADDLPLRDEFPSTEYPTEANDELPTLN
jgi:anti-sigma factor RsiW